MMLMVGHEIHHALVENSCVRFRALYPRRAPRVPGPPPAADDAQRTRAGGRSDRQKYVYDDEIRERLHTTISHATGIKSNRTRDA